MRNAIRETVLAGVTGCVLLLALAGTGAAKGNAVAALDKPIPPGAAQGTELAVGWRAWVPDVGAWPFSGSPVFIRLTSPDGVSSTEALGVEDPRGSGHYLATVRVPSGGAGLVEVGLFGESCVDGVCTRSDLLFKLPAVQRLPVAVASRPDDPAMPAPPRFRESAGRPAAQAANDGPADRSFVLVGLDVVAAGLLTSLAIVLGRRRARAPHGPARVAAPARAGLRRLS